MPTLRGLGSEGPDFARRLVVAQAIETILWIDALTRESFLDEDIALGLVSEFKIDLAELEDWFARFGWAFPSVGLSVVQQLTSGSISAYRSQESDEIQREQWLQVELAVVHVSRLYQNAALAEFVSSLLFADDAAWNLLLASAPSVSAVNAVGLGGSSIWHDGHRPLFYYGFFEFCSTMEAFLDFHARLHAGANAALGTSTTIKVLSGWRYANRSQASRQRLLKMAGYVDRVIAQYLSVEIQLPEWEQSFDPFCRDLIARTERVLGNVAASGASAQA